MLDLKSSRVTLAITMVLITAGAQASQDQYPATRDAQGSLAARIQAPSPPPQPLYETREIHDPNGTGKFYLGREIAQVMGPGGIVVFVEYRKEDSRVPIKEVHKMSVEQVEKEMKVVGLVHMRTLETLPSQHIVIFERRE